MGVKASGLGEYLRGRRDALQPEDVGLAREARRRVPGLRREEVAELAGISVEYYMRLEQGKDHQPSQQVLAALARALRLDADGGSYLFRLAEPPRRPHREGRHDEPIGPDLLALLHALQQVPAYITDPNRDVVASNAMAQAMVGGAWWPGRNVVLETFAPHVQAGMPGWEQFARRVVAGLRATADPQHPRLQEIVGTLSVRDENFRRWWAEHDVAAISSGEVPCYFAEFGIAQLRWHELEAPGRPGHLLTVFHADPGTPGHEALRDLALQVAAGAPSGPASPEAVPSTHRAPSPLVRS